MKLLINGEAHETPGAPNLAELVAALGLPPQTALIEHNGLALRRDEWATALLAEGDCLEILRISAGG